MKKHICLFFILLFLQHTLLRSQAVLNFQNLAHMNVGRALIGCAGDSNYFYVSNGFSSSSAYTALLERYDIANNTWSQVTNLLLAKRYNSSALIGNKLYVFNGILSNGAYNGNVEMVDLSNSTVTLTSVNPNPVKTSGCAVWNGSIYIFGGSTASGYSNALHRLDPATNTWTQLANMPEAKETTGEFVNGKLYVIGGYMGTTISNKIHVYDVQTDTWSALSSMPSAISGHSSAAYGSRIYTAFDYTYETYLGYYDIPSDTYTVLQQVNMHGRRNGGARIARGKLYIMGGDTTSSALSCLSGLQVADLTGTTVVTGISIAEQEASFEVYPNPASDLLNLKNCPEGAEFTVYDINGKLLMQGKCEPQIRLTTLSKGIYTLRISGVQQMYHKNFLIE